MVPLGSPEIREAKRALREEMRERRGGLSASAQRAAAEAACEHLLALLADRELAGKVVAAYVAVRGELDPAAAVEALRGLGARIALPRAEDGEDGKSWLRF